MSEQPDERVIGRPNSHVPKRRGAIPWIWQGVLADEVITLLSALEKVGKTTLLSLLLDRRRRGGTLLGRAVYPGRTVLCSEESPRIWEQRQPPLDFGPDLLFHEPDGDGPTRGRWKPLARRPAAPGDAMAHPGPRARMRHVHCQRRRNQGGPIAL
jgi:hypothetical protein